MTRTAEKPDFVVDQFGSVQDVRHLKNAQRAEQPPLPKAKIRPRPEAPVNRTEHKSQIPASCLLLALGGILVIGGGVLVIGNTSGAFPTFPFAGFLTSTIGFAMLAVGVKADREGR